MKDCKPDSGWEQSEYLGQTTHNPGYELQPQLRLVEFSPGPAAKGREFGPVIEAQVLSGMDDFVH